MNNDCEAIVVNLVESGAISTAQTIMNQIQAAGIPTVWFNRPVSTNNEEAANLFLNNPASAFVGTNFEDAGVMQGELIGQYLVEHYNDIDLNGDGKISYIMFKGDEANQEAIARTALAVEYANKALVAAGKPEIEFYDASNANKYLVDPNGSWSNVFSSEQMQTVLSTFCTLFSLAQKCCGKRRCLPWLASAILRQRIFCCTDKSKISSGRIKL